MRQIRTFAAPAVVHDYAAAQGHVDSGTIMEAFMGEGYEVVHAPAEAQAVLADFGKRSAHCQVLDRGDQPR